jgi:hypothetical protein
MASKDKPQQQQQPAQQNNNNNQNQAQNPNHQPTEQLLRLHVINAKFNPATKENKETWCQVTVGKKNAKTLSHPLTGAKDQPKEIKWDENFAIEYEKKDEDTPIHVEVYTKGLLGNDLLGEFKLKLNEIDPPKPKEEKKDKKDKKKEKEKEESWAMAKPKEAPLTDKKGHQTGTIILRVRRELKVYGTLVIDIKEAELTEPPGKIKSARCVVKIATHVQETPSAEAKAHKNLTHFVWKNNIVQIEIDQTNHIFDVFIELWDDHPANPPPQPAAKKDDPKNPEKKPLSFNGLLIGVARITIYDTRSKFNAQLPLLESTERKQVGTLKVLAKLKQNKEQKKISQKETKK